MERRTVTMRENVIPYEHLKQFDEKLLLPFSVNDLREGPRGSEVHRQESKKVYKVTTCSLAGYLMYNFKRRQVLVLQYDWYPL